MPDEKPVVYILQGDDREAIETHIKVFHRGLGAPDMADMNTTRLEGKSINLNDLRAAALALPFLTERRLVIVEDALRFFDKEAGEDVRVSVIELLDSLPPSTALVLVIPDTQRVRKQGGEWVNYWERLTPKHWLMQWASLAGSRVFIQECGLPSEREMARWIQKKASELGGNFSIMAAQTLVEYLGNNTQRTLQEIIKLLTYVNYERTVDDDDVRRLSIQDRESDIFAMVDAIAARDGENALKMLHLLLENTDFIQLFSMVIRQFRLMLQARELVDDGEDASHVAKILGLQPFIARKVYSQVQSFDLSTLKSIYSSLQKMDVDSKTGVIAGELALDIFVTRLAKGLPL